MTHMASTWQTCMQFCGIHYAAVVIYDLSPFSPSLSIIRGTLRGIYTGIYSLLVYMPSPAGVQLDTGKHSSQPACRLSLKTKSQFEPSVRETQSSHRAIHCGNYRSTGATNKGGPICLAYCMDVVCRERERAWHQRNLPAARRQEGRAVALRFQQGAGRSCRNQPSSGTFPSPCKGTVPAGEQACW